MIAYSVAGFAAKRFPDDTSISLNIVWAAVLACSEDPYVFFLSTCYLEADLVADRPCTSAGPRFFFHDDPWFEMLGSLIPDENDDLCI